MSLGGKNSKKSRRDEARERISAKATDAATAVLDLIKSVGLTIEERIAFEDQIKNASRGADSILGKMDDVARANKKKLLVGYRQFLQRNIEAVDQRLKEMD
jgi:hypothetical protein